MLEPVLLTCMRLHFCLCVFIMVTLQPSKENTACCSRHRPRSLLLEFFCSKPLRVCAGIEWCRGPLQVCSPARHSGGALPRSPGDEAQQRRLADPSPVQTTNDLFSLSLLPPLCFLSLPLSAPHPLPGNRHLCWLRPASPHRITLPPPCHTLRPLLQMQVQQGRR